MNSSGVNVTSNVTLSQFEVFLTVSLTSVSASLQTVLQIVVGMFLTHPKINILNRRVSKSLSQMVLYIMLPLFHLMNFANSLTWELIADIWIIPIIASITMIVGNVLGELLYSYPLCFFNKKIRFMSLHRTILIMTMTYQNGGFIIFMFLESFAKTNLFVDPNRMQNYMAYITVYLLTMNFWVFGYALGCFSKSKSEEEREKENLEEEIELEDVIITQTKENEKDSRDDTKEDEQAKEVKKKKKENQKKRFRSRKEQWKEFVQLLFVYFKKVVKFIVTPPMVGMTLGILIAFIPGLKWFFIDDPPLVVDGIYGVIQKYGGCVIPFSMLVTGSNLGHVLFNRPKRNKKKEKAKDEEEEKEEKKKEAAQQQQQPREQKTILFKQTLKKVVNYAKHDLVVHNSYPALIINLLGKLMVIPSIIFVVVLGLAFLARETGFISPEIRPLLWMCLVVEATAPHALMLNTIASVYSKGQDQMAEIMIIQYFIAPVTMVVWSCVTLYVFCLIDKNQCTLFV